MCETSASVEYFLDGCLGKVVCLCALVYVSIACPEGRNGSGSVTPTQRETSRTRCVWGNTVVPELPSPPQRARPFHSHSIQTQASPFHLSRGVHITFRFFGWTICSSLSSSSFGGWTACSADSLVQNLLFRHWHRKPSRFHCHRVPDSFQWPHCDGFVEVRDPLDLVRALLIVRSRACFLLEGERSWEIFLGFARSCTKPPSWDAHRAYLSFPLLL